MGGTDVRQPKPQRANDSSLMKGTLGFLPTRTGLLGQPASFHVSPAATCIADLSWRGEQITSPLSVRQSDAGCLTVVKGLYRPQRRVEVIGSYLFKKGPATAIAATGYFAKGLFVMFIAGVFPLVGFSEWSRLYCTARVIPKESGLAVALAKSIF